jgi:hypothetical protein
MYSTAGFISASGLDLGLQSGHSRLDLCLSGGNPPLARRSDR